MIRNTGRHKKGVTCDNSTLGVSNPEHPSPPLGITMTIAASIPRRISVGPVAIPNSPMSPIVLDEETKCTSIRIDTATTRGGDAAGESRDE